MTGDIRFSHGGKVTEQLKFLKEYYNQKTWNATIRLLIADQYHRARKIVEHTMEARK